MIRIKDNKQHGIKPNIANKHKKGSKIVRIQTIIDNQIKNIDTAIFKADRAEKQRDRRRAKRR
jgi:hypothetical protein|tara:strand:+ start:242 stop:430 length:189 start_codon:yes stop_codon:yes gene_type:complete